MSRVQPLIDKMTGVEDPDDLMMEIMELLPETVESTEVDVETTARLYINQKHHSFAMIKIL